MALSEVISGGPVTSTGGVQFGGLETDLPTSVIAELTGFSAAGFIGEDGLTETIGRETEKVKAWGGTTVKVLQTDFEVTYTFQLLEALGTTALQAVHGADNVSGTLAAGSLTVAVNNQTLPHQSMVFDIKDGDARLRIVLPDAQITEVGETTYSHNAVVGYEVTVEAFQDADGNNAYKYASTAPPTPEALAGGGGAFILPNPTEDGSEAS